ncbi:MAG: hypothetical protein IT198_07710 [Acidimicrobiia bacterium]|nr:hypothetical protein [Acidimicrobiia bacterium]
MKRRAGTLMCAVVAVCLLVGGLSRTSPAGADETYPRDDTLRLNEVQHLASHNSYRQRSVWPIPLVVRLLEYGHAPLPVQLGFEGVRAVELDVHARPGGTFRVLHIPVVDERSTCETLVACLAELEAWSDANPMHAPIFVQIEPKDDLSSVKVSDHYDALDATIRSVLPPEKLITPDDVRGSHTSLVEAIAADGWPTLGETRGKMLFYLDVGAGPLTDNYLDGHPDLAGRVAFPNGSVGESWAVVFVENDPVSGFDEIQDLVSAGYIVRTRADDDVRPEPAQTAAALASGAQIVSTDFESPGHLARGDWSVSIPGGTPSGCNPVSAPADCTPADVESGIWARRPQRLRVDVRGPTSWSLDTELAPETFVVGIPGDEFLYQVTGSTVVPGATGGDATVSLEASTIIGLPLYVGSLKIRDPGAGVRLDVPLLFTPLARSGINGATGSAPWCSARGCGRVAFTVETL